MKSIDRLLIELKKNGDYRPFFLLSWSRLINHDILVKTDNIDAYDAFMFNKELNSDGPKEWDRTCIAYNEENVKMALCITVNNAINDIFIHDNWKYSLLVDDIACWLDILENTDIKKPCARSTKMEVLHFLDAISKYYEFNLESLNSVKI